GDLRALGPATLPGRVAAVRRGERAGAGAAIGRRHIRLLPVQRRALRADAGDHHRDQLARSRASRPARRAAGSEMSLAGAETDDIETVRLTVPPALEAIGLSKSFGPMRALDDVSLLLERGTVHALLGENGAGKSTLVKCIMGYYRADAGRVSVDGTEARIASPRDAAALGIGMVYQHFTLVDAMTVAENLVLARRQHPFVFDWAAERTAIATFMEKMPFQLDPARPVRPLAAGGKQKLEILKQLYLGSSIVILDEPTSVLTPAEADEVLGLLRGMVKDGRLTVLMISHKFREVMQFADEVT